MKFKRDYPKEQNSERNLPRKIDHWVNYFYDIILKLRVQRAERKIRKSNEHWTKAVNGTLRFHLHNIRKLSEIYQKIAIEFLKQTRPAMC